MNVLHINDHLQPKGGVETYLLSLIPRLENAGIGQAVAYGRGDSKLVKNSFRIPQISTPGWADPEEVRNQLDSAIDDFNPDVIHLHSVYNVKVVEHLLHRKPVVLTSHDFRYLCPSSTFFYRRTRTMCERSCGPGCFTTTVIKQCMTLRPRYTFKYYQRVVRVRNRFQSFKHLIAPGKDAAKRFIRDGFPADRVTVLPYFCRILPLAEPRPIPTKQVILFLGRMSDYKGIEYFIEALGRLPDRVEGMIIGHVTEPDQLEALARRYGCHERLSWKPWASQEEVSRQLFLASVLIFPSLWPETLGIVGLEAMAHGVPVIASDIGGVPEWCLDGETGFRVPPKDAEAIADRVLNILNDEKLAYAMGSRALVYVKERFSPDDHVDTLQNIYEKAAS